MRAAKADAGRLWIRCGAAAIAAALSVSGVMAQQAPELRWPGSAYSYSWSVQGKKKSGKKLTFDITPYLWATGIDGPVGVRERTADVDITFRDILDNLKGAFMMPAELWYGRLGLGAELIWTKVSDGEATPGPLFTDAELDVSQFIADISPRIRIVGTDGRRVSRATSTSNGNNGNNGSSNKGSRFTLDGLVGIRYWSLNNTLTLTPGLLPAVKVELDESWGDPYVGARAFLYLSDRWGLQVRGDVGGFDVGSKFAWQALGVVSYRIGSWGTVRLGYRQLDVDYEIDSTGFLYDVGIGGVLLGLTLGT
jgi:hypothetical protein